MDVLNCQEIDSSGLLYVFIYSSIHHEDLLKSENVISADISRVSLLSNNLIAVNNLGPFIHNLILEMCILADNSMSKYNTVLNHGTWFDLAATSDYGVSTVPSMMQPLEITEFLTSAPSRY